MPRSMMGVVAPLVTGYIVGATGSFVRAFLTAGMVLAVGIVAYVFILGRLEPIACRNPALHPFPGDR
jgi:dipeptide/tripeptide permease